MLHEFSCEKKQEFWNGSPSELYPPSNVKAFSPFCIKRVISVLCLFLCFWFLNFEISSFLISNYVLKLAFSSPPKPHNKKGIRIIKRYPGVEIIICKLTSL